MCVYLLRSSYKCLIVKSELFRAILFVTGSMRFLRSVYLVLCIS